MTGRLTVRPEALDAPVAAGLIARLQADLAERYGEPDPTPTPPAEFAPPRGTFLVATLDDLPVACAGVRLLTPETAELKRMYVDESCRRRGVARTLLAEIEAAAVELGAAAIRLETGVMQPEAVALYRSAGYLDIPQYAHPEWEQSLCMEKSLPG